MGKNLVKTTHTFLFCDGGSCQKAGSENVVRAARLYLRNNDLWDTTHTIKTRCNGRCEDAPTCIVQNGNHWYKELTPEKMTAVVKSHVETNTPIDDYLLYNDEWQEMRSNNERPAIKPKDFVLKQDDDLGEVYITKGFNSDQYLFPLFEFLKEKNIQGTIHTPNGTSYPVSELKTVTYNDAYTLFLTFTGGTNYPIVIGSVPKHEEKSLIQAKISSTEYFIDKNNFKKGIRFKNKMGKFVMFLEIASQDVLFWNYCLNIQLLGLENPIHKNVTI